MDGQSAKGAVLPSMLCRSAACSSCWSVAEAAAPMCLLRGPARLQVPSFCVRTNDACSLNNTPASSINGLPLSARIGSPDGRQQAGTQCAAAQHCC